MSKYEMVTVETLTDEQITSLRREAAVAGDVDMVGTCDVALTALGGDRELQRQVIVDAINYTRAQG